MGRYSKDWSWNPDPATKDALKRKPRKRKPSKNKSRAAKKKRRQDRKRRERQERIRLCLASGDDFYLSKPWRALRRRVFRKYGVRCMKCGVENTEMHIDHIIPRSQAPGLSLDFENLQVLCRDCNMDKSNKHSTDYRNDDLTELAILVKARSRQ
jgi:5-methylcytosine-specific restriction endonuclease McrA